MCVAEAKKDIFAKVQEALYHDQYSTCAVCDELSPTIALPGEEVSRAYSVSELPAKAFTVLRAEGDLHPELKKQYDVSGLFPQEQARRLEGLLLSPRGVLHTATMHMSNLPYISPREE